MITALIIIIVFVIPISVKASKEHKIKTIKCYKKKYPDAFLNKFGPLNDNEIEGLAREQLKEFFSVDESELRNYQERHDRELERRKKEEQEKIRKICHDYELIKDKYPHGIKTYETNVSLPTKEAVIRDELLIKKYERYYEEYSLFTSWKTNQHTFSTKCQSICKSVIDNWGRYLYSVDVKGITLTGIEKQYKFSVLHAFRDCYCMDDALDYSYWEDQKDKRLLVQKLKNEIIHYVDFVFDEIMNFIKKLGPSTIVVFADWGQEDGRKVFIDYHFSHLILSLSNNDISYTNLSFDNLTGFYNKDFSSYNNIVIIELITTYEGLFKTCKAFLNQHKDIRPCIVYLSLMKEHSSEEMSKIIEDNKQKEKDEAEKERQEQERIATEQRRKSQEKQELLNAVSLWQCVPSSSIPYYYLIRYYPTTCEFEANDDEWNDRQLIWSFKNDPNKSTRIPHHQALSVLIPRISSLLKNTFKKNISGLTLVCIPASSEEKNSARYKTFSDILCRETGMSNAYNHITIIGGRTAKHLGGDNGGLSNIDFDTSYFTGRNVLLFDDVLTRGQSMRLYASKMSSLGATVIAAITIGKTFHERD